MEKPDQRLLEADLLSAEFRTGVAKGYWNLAGTDVVPEEPAWPNRVFWLAAAARTNAPTRFHILLDLTGYRTVPPTGAFWDPGTKTMLELPNRPKGKDGSRFAKVFRTDWEGGRAFYHPYDRLAANSHPEWSKDQPHLVWTTNHTIVDYLHEFHTLLNHGDYHGI